MLTRLLLVHHQPSDNASNSKIHDSGPAPKNDKRAVKSLRIAGDISGKGSSARSCKQRNAMMSCGRTRLMRSERLESGAAQSSGRDLFSRLARGMKPFIPTS
ncbi:hypothetical protein D3C76_806220 [compost metagenome]